jgi:hypothetical protein
MDSVNWHITPPWFAIVFRVAYLDECNAMLPCYQMPVYGLTGSLCPMPSSVQTGDAITG